MNSKHLTIAATAIVAAVAILAVVEPAFAQAAAPAVDVKVAGFIAPRFAAQLRRAQPFGSNQVGTGVENGEHLAFGHHVVELDEDRCELARRRRGHRDFHLHGLDEGDVLAVADAGPGLHRKCADAAGHLGHNLDLWHSIPQRHRLTAIAPVNGFLLWRQIA